MLIFAQQESSFVHGDDVYLKHDSTLSTVPAKVDGLTSVRLRLLYGANVATCAEGALLTICYIYHAYAFSTVANNCHCWSQPVNGDWR